MECRVLLARILSEGGDLEAAGQILADIRTRQAEARARGSTTADLVPSEEVFFSLAELLVHGGTSDAWEDVAARAKRYLTSQDLSEVLRVAGARASTG